MGLLNYISDSEAASRTGVSVATLERFVEAGYLRVESDSDGLRLFSQRELDQVFGLRPTYDDLPKTDQPKGSLATQIQSSSSESASLSVDSESPQIYWAETLPPEAPASVESSASSFYSDLTQTPVEPQEASRGAAAHARAAIVDTLGTDLSARERSPADVASSNGAAADDAARELAKLKLINEMLEKLLAMREQALDETRKERDWLRTRYERAEEKADRDQLLLLTQTQMNRRLVALQEHRQSPVRAALQWIGLLPAPQPDTAPTTISGSSQQVTR